MLRTTQLIHLVSHLHSAWWEKSPSPPPKRLCEQRGQELTVLTTVLRWVLLPAKLEIADLSNPHCCCDCEQEQPNVYWGHTGARHRPAHITLITSLRPHRAPAERISWWFLLQSLLCLREQGLKRSTTCPSAHPFDARAMASN